MRDYSLSTNFQLVNSDIDNGVENCLKAEQNTKISTMLDFEADW